MGRFRQRLDQLQAEANQTMADAQALLAKAGKTITVSEKALLKLVQQSSGFIVLATDAVNEVMDGIEAEGELEIMEKVIPVKGRVKIKFREEEPPK